MAVGASGASKGTCIVLTGTIWNDKLHCEWRSGDEFGSSVALSGLNISFDSTSGYITSPFTADTNSGLVSQTVETADPSQGGSAFYYFTVTQFWRL